MKAYPEYKASGIDWLGEMPSHWTTLPLKTILSKSNSGVWGDEAKNDGTDVVCFRVADFDYPHLRLKYDNITYRSVPQHQLNGREVKYGDIVIEKSGGGELSPVGRAVISFFNGIATCSNFMHVISVGGKANNLFINYLLASIYSQGLSRLFFVQTTGIQNLNIKDYLSQIIALPPIEEQEQIAAYLDDVTGKIDELVKEKQAQLDDIRAYRTSLITETVTRGLNPNAPLKDSGIDWLGEIPEHWNKTSFKYFLTQVTDPSSSLNKIGLENIESGTGRFIESNSIFDGNGIEFKKGDILYGKLRPYLRKVWVAEFEGNAVGDFFVYRVMNIANERYAKWLFLSDGFNEIINSSTDGAKMPRVSSDFVKNLPYYLPPLSEQQEIADFLDAKTAKIDELVKEKQAQLDDIRAYRTSLITETVTRGLNPDAPLKDSGIDWLGEVPEHWDLVKSSYLFDNIGSGTTPTSGEDYYYDNGTINWLQTGDLNDGIIEATNKRITQLAVDSKNMKFYNPGSLVIAMYGATIAKLGLLNINTTVNQACCVLTPSNNIISKYSFYYFYAAKKDLISLASGGGQPNISQATIANYKILIPPLSEQQEIADFLDAKTAKIDELIESLSKQIEELAEYKRAVITEAVTGKVDVRDWEPKA